MVIGNKTFDSGTYIMGILNVTPDSFSDGNLYNNVDMALKHVGRMISEGASIIDVGGESTRPGYTKISDEEEIDRIYEIIRQIKLNYDIIVSVDTYKSNVAKSAIEAGADMVNDIWGLKYDAEMAKLVAKHNVPVCIMHNNSRIELEYNKEQGIDNTNIYLKDIEESLEIARKNGISKENIILDPGVGFAKTYNMNKHVINKLELLNRFDCPILLAASRKSVIGLTLDLPKNEREEGTLATTVMAVMKGARFVRVHDVKANKRAIDMTRAILEA